MAELKNNYAQFKESFKKDTNLDADKNVAEYLQYINFRVSDWQAQILVDMGNKVLNKLDFLPNQIAPTIMGILKEYKKLP